MTSILSRLQEKQMKVLGKMRMEIKTFATLDYSFYVRIFPFEEDMPRFTYDFTCKTNESEAEEILKEIDEILTKFGVL